MEKPVTIWPDPTGKPILLCLTASGGLDDWITGVAGLKAFVLLQAHDLFAAAEMGRTCRPDLLILDRQGFGDLPPDYKERFASSPLGRTPVILIDQSPGELEAGSLPPVVEDVLPDDLSAEQAAIRLRAVLRRERPTALSTRVTWNRLELRHDQRTVLVAGQPLLLTHQEFNLLALLMEEPGQVWSHEELMRTLWGGRVTVAEATLYRLVQRVRQQIVPLLGHDPVKSVRGTGYRLA